MTDKKIYSAFISSNFQSLRDERNAVINNLLDFRILPIGMEHFTVSTNGEFSDIEALIDDSDFFILLLGARYGSCDGSGISWTEREYLYADQKKKPILAIVCDELSENLAKEANALSEDSLKQIEFCKRIKENGFVREVTEEFGMDKIVKQFLNTQNFSKCVGWTRIEDVSKDENALAEWRKRNSVFDIAGCWHHIHLSAEDENYIRVGTVRIEQDFTPNNYNKLKMNGENYSVLYYDTQKNDIRENIMQGSKFTGEYTLQENGTVFGIFNSIRTFNGQFGSETVSGGTRRGIHDFSINVFNETTDFISGDFHDEAPSPKLGKILLFRTREARNEFLLDHRGSKIEKR